MNILKQTLLGLACWCGLWQPARAEEDVVSLLFAPDFSGSMYQQILDRGPAHEAQIWAFAESLQEFNEKNPCRKRLDVAVMLWGGETTIALDWRTLRTAAEYMDTISDLMRFKRIKYNNTGYSVMHVQAALALRGRPGRKVLLVTTNTGVPRHPFPSGMVAVTSSVLQAEFYVAALDREATQYSAAVGAEHAATTESYGALRDFYTRSLEELAGRECLLG